MPFALVSILVFILGTILGSFFNVCIHRLPREQSIVWPGSMCPSCKKSIAWYDNIPILSFLILGAKCRFCKQAISHRYWVVELITGFAYVWIFFYFGLSFKAAVAAFFFSMLLVVSFVDMEHQIIPDEISLGGLVAGLVLSAVWPALHQEAMWWRGLLDSFIGLLAGGGIIYLTGVIGNIIFRKESMGGGDVKLLAMMGAFLGWQKVLFVYLAAPVIALPLGLYMKFVQKKEVIPFGPFLALAGWLAFVWGDRWIAWYFGGLQF